MSNKDQGSLSSFTNKLLGCLPKPKNISLMKKIK